MTQDRHLNSTASFAAQWPWWLAPSLATLTLALVFQDPFAGDWDSLDYTVLAVQGRPSSMILGRMLFIFYNHGLWRLAHGLFGLQPENAYLLFKYAVILQSPLATLAWWTLARDLTGSVRAATAAALMLALSPYYILYSGQAMTEIPSLLLTGTALILHLRGLRSRNTPLLLVGAALLGLSVNLREAAVLYAPWLVLAPYACGWRWRSREVLITLSACVIFMLCAFGPFAYVWLMNVDSYRQAWHVWAEATRMESARHPVSSANLGPLFHFFFVAAPLALVAFSFAFWKEWRQRGFSPLLVMGATGMIANLALIVHYSLVLNGRYLLTGAPAIMPLVADYFLSAETARWRSSRRAFLVVVTGIILVAVLFAQFHWPSGRGYVARRALAKDYRERLALVPCDAVIIAGGQTVAVTYWRGLGAGQWEIIGSGGGWPGSQLAEVIEQHLRAGRRVFLDADPRWWTDPGWQEEETRTLVSVAGRFRFRRLSETIYEIRPPEDQTANDSPHLERLLQTRRDW